MEKMGEKIKFLNMRGTEKSLSSVKKILKTWCSGLISAECFNFLLASQ